jgi:hypothetical protein
MVLMSAVMPAPDEGSNPAIVSTTGGFSAMAFRSRKLLCCADFGTESHIGKFSELTLFILREKNSLGSIEGYPP